MGTLGRSAVCQPERAYPDATLAAPWSWTAGLWVHEKALSVFMLPIRACHDSPSRVMASAKPSHLSAWENRINRGTESPASQICWDPDAMWPQTSASCFLASVSPRETRTRAGGHVPLPHAHCAALMQTAHQAQGEAAPALWPLGSPAFAGALETGCWLDPFRGDCSQRCTGPVPLGLHPVGAVRREEPPFSASQGRCVTPSGGWSPFAGYGPPRTCGPHPMCSRSGCGL